MANKLAGRLGIIMSHIDNTSGDSEPHLVGFYSSGSTPRSVRSLEPEYFEEDSSTSTGTTHRDVIVRDGDFRIVAGVIQRRNITVAKFYSWLNIVLDEGSCGQLFHSRRSGSVYVPDEYKDSLDKSSQALLINGEYLLLNPDRSPCKVVLSSRTYLPRIRTQNTTPSPESRDFTQRVVGRDTRCCFSGKQIGVDPGKLFQAAHIYPTAWRETWLREGYNDMALDDSAYGIMNSSSNGLTMTADFHLHFCYYHITVDPENFRLLDFTLPGVLSRSMRGHLLLDTYEGDISLLRSLLREHYENTILLNVRGDGIYGDPQSLKTRMMTLTESYDINLARPVFQSGIGKEFFETTLATRLYYRLEGVEPWPRTDDKGKYDTMSQILSHTPSPFRSAGWSNDLVVAVARADQNLAIRRHHETRPFHPLWD